MKSPVVVIGIGEVGSVLARGYLKTGHPVYPITRDMDLAEEASNLPKPMAVVVAVGESELHNVLSAMPDAWRSNLILIQNELLPRDWQQHGLDPTVISVWFEKKKGQDVKVVVASTIHGSQAKSLAAALESLDIPSTIIADADQMTLELVRKNYYILTSNIAGLRVGGTVGELWQNHRDFATQVIADVNTVQEHLVGEKLQQEGLTQAMLRAFDGDLDHGCMGRSAPARLQRALDIANAAGLDVPMFKEIAEQDV